MKKFRDFESARKYARSLGLKNYAEWREYCKSGERPVYIPAQPSNVYKKEWTTWGKFLGTGNITSKNRTFLPFKEAREFVRSLGLKNYQDWKKYCKSGDKPEDIPVDFSQVYKKEWKGWGDCLGRKYILFKEARKFVRSLGLKNYQDWKKYCKSGDKPDDIPSYPNQVYREWKGMGDWLGTGTIGNKDKVYRPYKEARDFVRSLGLNNKKEWLEYCKSGDKPEDIPSYPNQVYKEWKRNEKV